MGRPGKSRHQRRERALARERAEREFGAVPHSFVFPRGRAGRSLRGLARDIRRVLEPYTARNLQVRRSNSLRDVVAVAGPLGVTQFVVLSKSQSGVNLKLFRLPGGPTLTFKVLQYSLVRDVVSALRRHRMHEQQFLHPPLLVLGNFGSSAGNPSGKFGNSSGKFGNPSGKFGNHPGNSAGQMHLKLMAGMFQGMFPALNVHKVNLNSIRRCLLISYSSDSQLLELRHYSVKVVPVGLSRGLRKILQEKFPNLGRLQDISELLTGEVALSESEAEPDGTQNVTELPQKVSGRGNSVTQQSAIRLTEIGPRLTLQLLKVEEGLGQGNVLYHGLAPKGEAEVRALLARKEQQLQAKAERRRKQEQDLERKRRQRELHRERSLAGMGRARASSGGPGDTGDPDGDSGAEDPGADPTGDPAGDPAGDPSTPGAGVSEDEDEAEYYRQELGEEPDPDLFPSCSKRKRSFSGDSRPRKRRRKSPGGHTENPKFHPKNNKSPKSNPKNNKSHPKKPKFDSENPKFHPKNNKFHPKNPKFDSENPKFNTKNNKFHQKSSKSPKSDAENSKSHPGNPKFHPKNPKSHPKNPKSQQKTPKSHQKTPKFHPKNPKSPKSHSGNSKSSPKNPKSTPKNPKSQKSSPKNPKSQKSSPKNARRVRGKLLGSRKNSIFQRLGKARKGKN